MSFIKNHSAKVLLNKELADLWDDLDDHIEVNECPDMIEDLNDFVSDHNDPGEITGFRLIDLSDRAFGIHNDSKEAERIKHVCVNYIESFRKQYNISIHNLSNEAQENYSKLLIDAVNVSHRKKAELRDKLRYEADPQAYFLAKAIELGMENE